MTVNPVRLQTYLPREMYDELRQKSAKLGLSMAEVVRQAVDEYLAKESDVPHPDDPIWRLPELGATYGSSQLRDAAADHDKYIYDEDRR